MPTDDPEKAAEYIISITRGLVEAAKAADLGMVAYLLEMALLEAEATREQLDHKKEK